MGFEQELKENRWKVERLTANSCKENVKLGRTGKDEGEDSVDESLGKILPVWAREAKRKNR